MTTDELMAKAQGMHDRHRTELIQLGIKQMAEWGEVVQACAHLGHSWKPSFIAGNNDRCTVCRSERPCQD